MAYRNYSSYSAKIRKSDHLGPDGKLDLHVHLFYNKGKSRRLLGRYRLPSLEPVFPQNEPELHNREIKFIKDWLAQPERQKKLQNFLEETLFDMHKIGRLAKEYGEIIKDKSGDTYITIRVPVSKRIR
ncbi:hypothetical protein BMS3Abin16_01370 [archaeon BMS3Abin16]|nr:hypothetical protein BMS3Abin16_01370 [archaeon BMS3Abin16]HDY73517.1 hypothetical protein [Euryarchaeota archaeon]